MEKGKDHSPNAIPTHHAVANNLFVEDSVSHQYLPRHVDLWRSSKVQKEKEKATKKS